MNLFIVYSQYHGCWCPGDARGQGINSNATDLIFMESLASAPGPHLNINTVFPGMGIPMLKLLDHIIFNMGIPMLVRYHLYIDKAHCRVDLYHWFNMPHPIFSI